MRYAALFLVGIAVVCFMAAPRGSDADPECITEWCKLDATDPACEAENPNGMDDTWAVRFPSSPSAGSEGSCSSYNMDNEYTDVEFFRRGCDDGVVLDACLVFSSSSNLAGNKYPILEVDGLCFKICATCP